MRLVTLPGVFAPISDTRLLAARLRAERPGAQTRVLDRVLAEAPGALAPGGSLLVVHSSVCGEEPTLDRLRDAGLGVEVLDRVRGPLGPLMRERTDMLVARGLLPSGAREEEVLVIAGRPGRPGRASVKADGA